MAEDTVSQLASLPPATAKALEHVVETMLTALQADSGAIWMEHENRTYTLIVRNLPLQRLMSLQRSATVRNLGAEATLVHSQQVSYAVARVGHPLLRVCAAVGAQEMDEMHRQLLPRFAHLTQALLQCHHSPMRVPEAGADRLAYRVMLENTLRRVGDLLRATGCALLWFSSWNNLWHRFTVGNVPVWMYQQLWETPSPGEEFRLWAEGMCLFANERGYFCIAEEVNLRDTTRGCLLLWRQQPRGRFTHEEVEWLRTMVQMVAASLDVLETQTELLQRVYQDPLTGVFNRLYFDLAYRQILHNAQRHPRPVSLLLIDIDNFKQINDTHGHEMGDMVLQVVGQALQQVRTGDIPARYGGDEFVVLLPDTDKQGARALAERLQNVVCQSAKHLGLPFCIALSIGCATVTDGDPSLLLLADRDMYEQKRVEKPDCTAT